MVEPLRIAHLSDLHFGVHCDLAQVRALEAEVPALGPNLIVLSGDLTQRARHGEFQRALAFVEMLGRSAPVLVVPGNHDVEWWKSPFHIFGSRQLHAKYRGYFGPELAGSVDLPGILAVGLVTAHGVALPSMTWNLNDLAVKGHLPPSEISRAASRFAAAHPAKVRVLVFHHNLLRGQISRRMGLARWRAAQHRVLASGAELVLCGHDHQEAVVQCPGGTVVVASGTHTNRTRGGKPTIYQQIEVREDCILVQSRRWDAQMGSFQPAAQYRFARRGKDLSSYQGLQNGPQTG